MKHILLFFLLVSITSIYSQNKYTVILPENYNKEKSYPLFIALHGGHGNMKDMQSYWTCETLSKDFIIAYMEASTLDRAPNRFGWRNLPEERKHIKSYYFEIITTYNINENHVYVGGFSLGAKTSIDLVLGDIIPLNGFVLLNLGGGLSDNCTTSNVFAARNRGVKGVVMMGELDHKYKPQTIQLKALLDAVEFQYQFIENKNTGHTTPNNFETVLESCIIFIRN